MRRKGPARDIWRLDAAQTGQRFASTARFASGIRNAVGIALDSGGRLFAAQHGPRELGTLYSAEQGQKLPAEVLLEVKQGNDFGWPECYYDPRQPGRRLPGAQFPSAYSRGMFIASHGSWSRTAGPRHGFNVVFQPMRAGKAAVTTSCSPMVSPGGTRNRAKPTTARPGWRLDRTARWISATTAAAGRHGARSYALT